MENYRQLSAKVYLISKRLAIWLLTTCLFSTDISPVCSPSQLLSDLNFLISRLLSRRMSFVEYSKNTTISFLQNSRLFF